MQETVEIVETTEDFWDFHPASNIRVCTTGEVEGKIEKYKDQYVVRKNGRRYQVAKLVLETFDETELGNYKGLGTPVWEDENEENNSIDNLRWHWGGDGWSIEELKKRRNYVTKACALAGIKLKPIDPNDPLYLKLFAGCLLPP